MAKFDDFLGKKKEAAPILDLSKATANTKEEFRKLFDKVPDYKIKQEKVRLDDVKIKDKKFRFKTGKKDFKAMKEAYAFTDPIPSEMKSVNISDLASVPIDWRMLTTLRPKSRLDEEYFSRALELAKLELKTDVRDKRTFALDPQVRKSKNKAGVVEYRNISCADCGEDFCTGKICNQFSYDYFTRSAELPIENAQQQTDSKEKKKNKKVKRGGRSRSKTKKKSGGRSASPRKDKPKSSKKNRSKSPKKSPKKKSTSKKS